jgi:hypothetical protein
MLMGNEVQLHPIHLAALQLEDYHFRRRRRQCLLYQGFLNQNMVKQYLSRHHPSRLRLLS